MRKVSTRSTNAFIFLPYIQYPSCSFWAQRLLIFLSNILVILSRRCVWQTHGLSDGEPAAPARKQLKMKRNAQKKYAKRPVKPPKWFRQTASRLCASEKPTYERLNRSAAFDVHFRSCVRKARYEYVSLSLWCTLFKRNAKKGYIRATLSHMGISPNWMKQTTLGWAKGKISLPH